MHAALSVLALTLTLTLTLILTQTVTCAAGCTLRFLCKLKEPEILEPLIPTIKNNLEHRHSFVRRNGP